MLQLTGKGKLFPLLPKHKSRGGMLMHAGNRVKTIIIKSIAMKGC